MSSNEKAKKDLNVHLKSDDFRKYMKKLKAIDVETVKDPWDTLSSKNKTKLRTDTVLDELLGVNNGGIAAGKLLEIYGGYGSGKTQTVFTFIAEATQKGTVILIDTEYTWSPERQIQICKARGLDVDKMRENLIIYQPEDYEEQLAKVMTLPSKMDIETQERPKLQLIVLDSLLALVDDSTNFRGRQHLWVRAGIIRDMLRSLRNAAREHECVVLFTNQVSAVPDTKPFTPNYLKERGTGGNITRHRPDIILYFRRAKDPIRVARLMDSSELSNQERPFQINERGIDDVGEGTKQRYAKYKNKKQNESDEEDEETEE